MNGVRRARLAGQVRRAGAGDQQGLVPLLRDLGNGERDGGGGDVHDGVHAVLVEPAPGDAGADVRLVLMIGREDLDAEPLPLRPEILDRHPCGLDGAGSGDVGVEAALVVEHADAEDGRLLRRGRRGKTESAGKADQERHPTSSCIAPMNRTRSIAKRALPVNRNVLPEEQTSVKEDDGR